MVAEYSSVLSTLQESYVQSVSVYCRMSDYTVRTYGRCFFLWKIEVFSTYTENVNLHYLHVYGNWKISSVYLNFSTKMYIPQRSIQLIVDYIGLDWLGLDSFERDEESILKKVK